VFVTPEPVFDTIKLPVIDAEVLFDLRILISLAEPLAVLIIVKFPPNVLPVELYAISTIPVPLLVTVASLTKLSDAILPNLKFPDPEFVIVEAPVKTLPPTLLSEVDPVLIKLEVPLNVPVRINVGDVNTTLPLNVVEDNIESTAAPVNVRFCAVDPLCVNRLNDKVPVVKPELPTAIVFPVARVAVADVLLLQK
jgi:hypothetical protein